MPFSIHSAPYSLHSLLVVSIQQTRLRESPCLLNLPMIVTQLSPFHSSLLLFQTASRILATSLAPSTRVRLTTKEIFLCFLGSAIFILIGTLTINFFQNRQRPRK